MWGELRIAHAWLNLAGFVSLVIAGTLLHFFPTTVGARIAGRRVATLAVTALALAAPCVALGIVVGWAPVAQAGGLLLAIGSVSLAIYCAQAWHRRARWSTDAGWHAFVIGGLSSSVAWFVLGALLLGGVVLVRGAAPGAWSIELVAGPLIAGWVGLALLASVTHIVPALGPGDAMAHRRQRHRLGWAGPARLIVLDAGVAAVSIGLATRTDWLTVLGAGLLAAGVVATGGLVLVSLAVDLRSPAG
jgi:hypothetical protein